MKYVVDFVPESICQEDFGAGAEFTTGEFRALPPPVFPSILMRPLAIGLVKNRGE